MAESLPLRQRLRRWLFQTRGPETSPIVLGQRRIFIVPSRQGLLYGLVVLVMYSGAVNYNLGLGHALVFLLVSLGFTGMFHGFRNLVGLQLRPGRAAPVFAGSSAHFEVLLDNFRPEDRRALSLRFTDGAPVLADVAAQSTTAVGLTLPAKRRGWLYPGRLTLASAYPLGFFRAWSYPHPELRCLVYPAPIERPLPPLSAGAKTDTAGSEAGEDDFAGLRPRAPGDPLRHVAWKAFARDPEHRPLLVKRFAGGRSPELHLDWAQLPAEMDSETRLSVLAGWILACRNDGLRYTLRLPDRQLGPDSGERFADSCLTSLALFGTTDARDS